ncbi:MAG: hypothetical protein QGF67_13340 [Lentisphaeria bacterium]|jgi:hypothetical protein|nr:hypothetical protein [Lentisphaeria bacterium]MDP7742420.1 hypothetical protein [Lentisphaeria bacterium]
MPALSRSCRPCIDRVGRHCSGMNDNEFEALLMALAELLAVQIRVIPGE